MTQTSEEFNAAKKRFQAAWDRDDPAHPINDSVEVQRASQTMKSTKEALTRVGVDLQNAQVDGVTLDWSALKTAAIDTTRHSLGEMTAVRNAYGSALGHARVEMAAEGYDLAPVNGVVPNPPAPQPNQRTGSQPGSLDDALNQIAGASVPATVPPPQPAPMDPKAVETFKATAREMLIRRGVCLPTRSNRG